MYVNTVLLSSYFSWLIERDKLYPRMWTYC